MLPIMAGVPENASRVLPVSFAGQDGGGQLMVLGIY